MLALQVVFTALLIVRQEECCSLGDIGKPAREFQQEPALPVLLDWPANNDTVCS